MIGNLKKETELRRLRTWIALLALAANVFLSFLMRLFDLPLYLDCAGTMITTATCGIVPGLVVAVLTNIILGSFQRYAVYYVMISTLIALVTYFYIYEKFYEKKRIYLIYYTLIITVISGGLGGLFQIALLGEFQFESVRQTAMVINENIGIPVFWAGIITNLGLNLVDKGLSVIALGFVLYFIPADIRERLWNIDWKQLPLSREEMWAQRKTLSKGGHSIRTKITLLLILGSLFITFGISILSVKQYYDSEHEAYTISAQKTANLTAKMLGQYDMDSFLQYGKSAEGYAEALETMYDIREASPDIKYLYVVKIGKDACYAILDLETDGEESYDVGDRIEFEDAFGDYLADLQNGDEIEPVESNDVSGWLITAYAPVKNDKGQTICYVGADASLEYLSRYVGQFFIRVLFIFSGFVILIVVWAITYTDRSLVFPLNSLVTWTNGFMKGHEEQSEMDESVRTLRKVDIRTNDEIEKLYQSICDMAATTVNQVRDINYFADSTAKMQNGLIITMADMVENRDSDTGAHIQKTAEYVRIISESLKKNGYYLEKLTPKYMSDVVMSAPLHDVGKINISDTILNKPGKLTDEEYEIMKLHTIYGKEIMEKAITTVKGENYLKEARNMAAYHHERWDGKGYPEGLHGEVIPLSARIMAVADVFDALTSPRVYKPAFPLEKALAILEEGSGTQFDPKCVNAFMDALPEVKQVLRKYQNS